MTAEGVQTRTRPAGGARPLKHIHYMRPAYRHQELQQAEKCAVEVIHRRQARNEPFHQEVEEAFVDERLLRRLQTRARSDSAALDQATTDSTTDTNATEQALLKEKHKSRF